MNTYILLNNVKFLGLFDKYKTKSLKQWELVPDGATNAFLLWYF